MAVVDQEKENTNYLEKDDEIIEVSDKEVLSLLIEILFDLSDEDIDISIQNADIEEIKA